MGCATDQSNEALHDGKEINIFEDSAVCAACLTSEKLLVDLDCTLLKIVFVRKYTMSWCFAVYKV